MSAATKRCCEETSSPSQLWTLRICRTDFHNTLVAVRIFPDASVWELKVILAYVTRVHPNCISLHFDGNPLQSGQLKSASLYHLATVVFQVSNSQKRQIVFQAAKCCCPPLLTATHDNDKSKKLFRTQEIPISSSPCISASQQGKKLTGAACAKLIKELPQRRCMSEDLRSAIMTLTQCQEGQLPPTVLNQFEERIMLGERINSVEYQMGLSIFQLALVYAESPTFLIYLLHNHEPNVNYCKRWVNVEQEHHSGEEEQGGDELLKYGEDISLLPLYFLSHKYNDLVDTLELEKKNEAIRSKAPGESLQVQSVFPLLSQCHILFGFIFPMLMQRSSLQMRTVRKVKLECQKALMNFERLSSSGQKGGYEMEALHLSAVVKMGELLM